MIVYETGDEFEGHLLGEKIGAGGQGVVWRATEIALNREVALKLILLGHDDPATRAMFEREAQLSARLSHPNIVQVLHAGSNADGLLYLSQVYVRGTDLRHLLERSQGSLSLPLAIFVTTQILYALQYAHENGVVHRDVKPENVLVSVSGQVQLTDFGIAKALAHGATPSISTAVRGSAPYMAPEVIRMQPVGFNSDLWSVGVLMYELVMGRNPFMETAHDERESIMLKILNVEPGGLGALGGVLPGLDRIVSGLLCKNPAERYQTAADVLGDIFGVAAPVLHRATALTLQEHLASLPAIVKPPSVAQPAGKRRRTGSELRTSSMAGQVNDAASATRNKRRRKVRIAATLTAISALAVVLGSLALRTTSSKMDDTRPAQPAPSALLRIDGGPPDSGIRALLAEAIPDAGAHVLGALAAPDASFLGAPDAASGKVQKAIKPRPRPADDDSTTHLRIKLPGDE